MGSLLPSFGFRYSTFVIYDKVEYVVAKGANANQITLSAESKYTRRVVATATDNTFVQAAQIN